MLTPDSRTVFQTACICTKHVRKCTGGATATVTLSKCNTAVHDLEQLGEIIVPHTECSALECTNGSVRLSQQHSELEAMYLF